MAILRMVLVLWLAGTTTGWAAPRVRFELLTEKGFPLTGARDWVDLFRDLGHTSVRIRSASGRQEVDVRNLGTEDAPSYRVTGLLTARNRLALPGGGEFGLRDRQKIAAWITNLKENGIPGLTAVRVAFGLTSEELVDFQSRLADPVQFATQGVRSGDVARRLVRQIGLEVDVSAAARRAFARNEGALDDLRGISGGTALAALLRPLGLVMAPQKERGRVQLRIAEVSELEEFWPIGWPPENVPVEVAPSLFEYLTVEIKQTPVSEALAAIQSRVKIPFLLDHNSIVRYDVDLEKPVSYPRARTFYKRVLDSLLFKARLYPELRVDDAGKPFYWIRSSRQS